MNARSAIVCAARAAVMAALLLAAPGGKAWAGGKRAGVPKFEGAQEAIVRKQVMRVLKGHGFDLAKSREMETGVQNTGALLESDDGFQKVAKELALAVIVTGEVGKKRAKIVVHDGREGSVLGEASFPGANPRKIAGDVARSFWSKLGGALERGKTPSGAKKPQKAVAEAPEDNENTAEAGDDAAPAGETKAADAGNAAPAEGTSDDSGSRRRKKGAKADDSAGVLREEASTPESPSGPVPPTFEVFFGPTGTSRNLAYHQDYSSVGLRPYSLPLGAAAAVHVVWYPISAFSEGPMQHLGLEIGVEQSFGIQSTIGNDGTPLAGKTFGNTVHEFEGGLRYRIPFGAGSQAWFSATGGEHAFVFSSPNDCNSCRATLDIPDTIYRYARPGVGVRLELTSDISLTVGGGYRYIFNSGGTQLDTFFPHRTLGGVDAELQIGYRVTPMIEARLVGEVRRYFYDMHARAGDTFIAGGAIDQYLTFGVGMAVLLGGSERPAVAAAEEAPPPPKKHKRHKGEDGDAEGDAGEDADGDGGNAE
jgi:hypothetical protein